MSSPFAPSRELTPQLARRIVAKYLSEPLDRIGSARPDRGGMLVATESGPLLVVGVHPGVAGCHGDEFSTYSVRSPALGGRAVRGIGITWSDENLYSLETADEFKHFIEHLRAAVEPVELASLFAIFGGKLAYGTAHTLILGEPELGRLRKRIRPSELRSVEGLGPIRVIRKSTGLELEFFTYFLSRLDKGIRRPTTRVVLWRVPLEAGELTWESSVVGDFPDMRGRTPV